MKPKTRSIIFWAPRILTILLVAFLALFSLDVFDSQGTFWQIALRLLIHNIPSLVVLIVLVLAWHKEWIGAIIFPLFGLLYLIDNLGKAHWSAFAAITAPLVLVGLLFLLAWLKARRSIKSLTA
jgi:hypothetical protein